MGIERRYCKNHPDRPAIGICVITKAAICGECSTRYEGVNYSKEGLEILHRQRSAAKARRGGLWPVVCWLVAPGLIYLLYLTFWMAATAMIDLLH